MSNPVVPPANPVAPPVNPVVQPAALPAQAPPQRRAASAQFLFNLDIVKMEPEYPDSASTNAVPASALSIESPHRTAQLIVEGKPLYVNPHFLAEASPVFEALFFGSFQEAENKMVELKDELFVHVFDFLMVLGVCSGEERRKVTGRNCSALLRLADKFDVSIVRRQCEDFLTSRIFVETPSPKQLARILVTAAEIGMSSDILTNLVGLMAAVGVDQLLVLNMHNRLRCPKVSAALFACAAKHPIPSYEYNMHSRTPSIPSDTPRRACMLITCQRPGSTCDNCGIALCDEHALLLKCPKAKQPAQTPAPPRRRLVDGEICGFKVIPCRKRCTSVNAFFNPAPPAKKGK